MEDNKAKIDDEVLVETAASGAELSDDELDNVSGGANVMSGCCKNSMAIKIGGRTICSKCRREL